MSNQDRADFFKIFNSRFGKCLEPQMACKNKAIKAHSIQNARVIDLLEENGHVAMVKLRVSDSGPETEFQLVGRNAASTFAGFCSKHDTEIFSPIDTQPLDLTNPEHLFLIAYRSVARELHATMESAVKIQSALQKLVQRGEISQPKTPEEAAGMTAHLIKAYATYQYKSQYFDTALRAGAWNTISHDIYMVEHASPTVAVSALAGCDATRSSTEIVRFVLNIIPLSGSHTAVIFSYIDPDKMLARAELTRVLNAVDSAQKYELSKLIIAQIENFIVAPSYLKSWSSQKKSFILSEFRRTIGDSLPIQESLNLMLFR